jgi:hypothetical protein
VFALPFDINNYDIQSLLASSKFQIPELQRPYAWTTPQAKDLISDLEPMLKHAESNQSTGRHFFGMIVSIDRDNKHQVIDGQQRLTTISVLLALIQREGENLERECDELQASVPADQRADLEQVASAANNFSRSIYNQLWVNRGFQNGKVIQYEPRLTVSPEIRETYEEILDRKRPRLGPQLAKPARNLIEISELFERELVTPNNYLSLEPSEKYRHLARLLEVVNEGLVVVHMTSASASSGYDLFESLNATGVSLNELDLLKVWILSSYAASGESDALVAKQMRGLTSNDISQQREFFQHFCILRSSLKGFDGSTIFKVDSSDPTKEAKQLTMRARRWVFNDKDAGGDGSDEPLTSRISTEVALMERLSPIWFSIRGITDQSDRTPPPFLQSQQSKQIRSSLGHLVDVLRIKQGFPFFMHWASSYSDAPRDFAALISEFERFFFRYRVICGANERKVLRVLTELTTRIEADKAISIESIKQLLAGFIEEDANDDDFALKLPQKLGYGNAQGERTKYFLYRLALNSWFPPYIGDSGFHSVKDLGPNGERWTLEHIHPQAPDSSGAHLSNPALLNSIGNLCLLNPTINSRLSNKSFAEKRTIALKLQAEGINIVVSDSAKIFYQGSWTTWSDPEILERQEFLVSQALKVFKF